MNAIIDANVFIAAWHKRDQYADQGIHIVKKLVTSKIKYAFLTNYVLAEIVNYIQKKESFVLAEEIYVYLTQTDKIHIIYVDEMMENSIKQLFRKYKTLSLTDCSLIVLAEEQNIKTIYSFDKGFDKVKSIERREK
jgi:predicted nucleic acid-binding protein